MNSRSAPCRAAVTAYVTSTRKFSLCDDLHAVKAPRGYKETTLSRVTPLFCPIPGNPGSRSRKIGIRSRVQNQNGGYVSRTNSIWLSPLQPKRRNPDRLFALAETLRILAQIPSFRKSRLCGAQDVRQIRVSPQRRVGCFWQALIMPKNLKRYSVLRSCG